VLPAVQVLISERSLNTEAIRELRNELLITRVCTEGGLKILCAQMKDTSAILMRGADQDVGIRS
jgi:hypothetical protein